MDAETTVDNAHNAACTAATMIGDAEAWEQEMNHQRPCLCAIQATTAPAWEAKV
jgi:hypothetical protein